MVIEKKLKILLLTLEYPPQTGGVSRYYAGLVKHWPGEIKVAAIKLWWPLWPHWLPLLWSVNRLVRKEKIGMLWVGQVLPLGYAAWWLKKRKGIPYAVFTHGMDVLLPQKSWWKKRWLKKVLLAADLVATNSEFTRGEVLKLGVDKEKTVVVYPCPELNTELRIPNSELSIRDSKIILSVGRLIKRKGFDKVIAVMPRLLKRVPDLKYVIIGAGPEKDNLQSLIFNLQLTDKVLLLENVSDSELYEWYNNCALFALPCRQIGPDVEGFGLVFLEAALAGKPVVAGNSGGASEAMRHGYSGFVVNPDSAEDLYQALLKILTDDDFSRRLGEYGRQWVERNFQWEREVGKLEEATTK